MQCKSSGLGGLRRTRENQRGTSDVLDIMLYSALIIIDIISSGTISMIYNQMKEQEKIKENKWNHLFSHSKSTDRREHWTNNVLEFWRAHRRGTPLPPLGSMCTLCLFVAIAPPSSEPPSTVGLQSASLWAACKGTFSYLSGAKKTPSAPPETAGSGPSFRPRLLSSLHPSCKRSWRTEAGLLASPLCVNLGLYCRRGAAFPQQAVVEWLTPTSWNQLERFLGFASIVASSAIAVWLLPHRTYSLSQLDPSQGRPTSQSLR